MPGLATGLFACSRVQNLFHSVQLNVNNPHFLIMQGRITKVRAAASSSVLAALGITQNGNVLLGILHAIGAQHETT